MGKGHIREEKTMKISPKTDYRKPLYAIGAVAIIGATAFAGTGCFGPSLAGETTTYESGPELAGDVVICNEDTEPETVEEEITDGTAGR